jgi:hypothetical protein
MIFKWVFPTSGLVVRPDQRTNLNNVIYIGLWKLLPPGLMTVLTLFLTTGDIDLKADRGPSFRIACLDIGHGRYAQLVAHGEGEEDIFDRIIEPNTVKQRELAERSRVVIPPESYAYISGKLENGVRYVVGSRVFC